MIYAADGSTDFQIAARRLEENDLAVTDLVGQYQALEACFSMEESAERLNWDLANLTCKKSTGLTPEEIEGITGFSGEEQSALGKKKEASRKALDPALGKRLKDRDQLTAFSMLSKRYNRNGNLKETLQYSIDEFQDCMSPDELAGIQRAAKALDLSAFVEILGSIFARVRATAQ